MQGCNRNNRSSPVRMQKSLGQLNKTFTSLIYKCSYCFRVRSQGPLISYSAPGAREAAHSSGGRVRGTQGTRLIARLVLAALKVSGQVFLASLCLSAVRFCYVTKMHWPRGPGRRHTGTRQLVITQATHTLFYKLLIQKDLFIYKHINSVLLELCCFTRAVAAIQA